MFDECFEYFIPIKFIPNHYMVHVSITRFRNIIIQSNQKITSLVQILTQKHGILSINYNACCGSINVDAPKKKEEK